MCPPNPWLQEQSILSAVMLEAVCKLLEVTPTQKLLSSRGPQNVNFSPLARIEVGVSREGMWMLQHYCTPTTEVTVSGRVVSLGVCRSVHCYSLAQVWW